MAVADQGNGRIQVFYPDGSPDFAFGSRGTGDGNFTWGIQGVGVDGVTGMIAVTDHDRIHVFHPNGTFAFKFGKLGQFDSQFKGVDSVAWSPDGTHIATAEAGNKRVQIFDASGTFVRSFEVYDPRSRVVMPLWGVAWSPSGDLLATVGHCLVVYNGTQVDVRIGCEPSQHRVMSSGAWSPDGDRIAVAYSGDLIQAFNAASGESVFTAGLPDIEFGSALGVAYHPRP